MLCRTNWSLSKHSPNCCSDSSRSRSVHVREHAEQPAGQTADRMSTRAPRGPCSSPLFRTRPGVRQLEETGRSHRLHDGRQLALAV